MVMKKKGMAAFEKSAYDKKMDKTGKHGKEGSAKDMKADKTAAKKLGYMKMGGIAKTKLGKYQGDNRSEVMYKQPNGNYVYTTAGPTSKGQRAYQGISPNQATAMKMAQNKNRMNSADSLPMRDYPVFNLSKNKKGGSSFGMLSVKAGYDKNPNPTAADRIAGSKMKKGGATKSHMMPNGIMMKNSKMKMGGSMKRGKC